MIVLLEQRKVLLLIYTATGVRLVADLETEGVKMVYSSRIRKRKRGELKKVIDKLTPRQFQDAVENGPFSFAW